MVARKKNKEICFDQPFLHYQIHFAISLAQVFFTDMATFLCLKYHLIPFNESH